MSHANLRQSLDISFPVLCEANKRFLKKRRSLLKSDNDQALHETEREYLKKRNSLTMSDGSPLVKERQTLKVSPLFVTSSPTFLELQPNREVLPRQWCVDTSRPTVPLEIQGETIPVLSEVARSTHECSPVATPQE